MEERKISTTFVARIWLESGAGEDSTWRGHVRHVQGDEEAYFQDLGRMNEFLERVSGVAGLTWAETPLKDATKPESGKVIEMKRKD